jgi:polysaccharide export outer membrane protein
MRDIIRSANTGRCALALLFLCFSVVVCFGQLPPVQRNSAAQNPQATTVDPKPPDVVKPPDDAKPAEDAKPAPQDAKPADGTATVPRTTETAPAAGPAMSVKKGKAPKKGSKEASADSSGGMPTFNGVSDKPYEIGPEDVLFLNVLHQADVTGTLEVRPDGFVSVRFAGEIKAAGLTTQQLSDEIADKLTKYYNHPEVNVQVVRINSKKYYISGEVRKQGAYSLSTPKTVLEAIIEAGGLADFAKKKGIYILRGQQKIAFNYADVSKGKNLGQNILVQNGDVIVVP